jgi:hypothetical protein
LSKAATLREVKEFFSIVNPVAASPAETTLDPASKFSKRRRGRATALESFDDTNRLPHDRALSFLGICDRAGVSYEEWCSRDSIPYSATLPPHRAARTESAPRLP